MGNHKNIAIFFMASIWMLMGEAREVEFDCKSKSEEWTDKKKEFCCENDRVGCPKEEFDCKSKSEEWTDEKKKFCCENDGVGCPKEEFDCKSKSEEWTDEKKEFCCEKQ